MSPLSNTWQTTAQFLSKIVVISHNVMDDSHYYWKRRVDSTNNLWLALPRTASYLWDRADASLLSLGSMPGKIKMLILVPKDSRFRA